MLGRTALSRGAFALLTVCASVVVAPASTGQCQSSEFRILISPDVFNLDEFGAAISVSGPVAMVGAPLDGDYGTDYGAAYSYRFDGASWNFEDKVTPDDAGERDSFGVSVAVSGDVAVVGANFDDDGGTDSGSAYVFEFDGRTWVQVAKLRSSDLMAYDNFGISVGIDGDVVVVGANLAGADNFGAAYVFVKPRKGWRNMTETAKLTASDAEAMDELGISVAVSGDVVVVGTQFETSGGPGAGAVYAFERPERGWTDMTETAKLTASDAAEQDRFGYSVSVGGPVVVVGAWGDDDRGDTTGSIYVFEKPSSGWANATETAKLHASDPAAGDHLGWSVAISGDIVVAGAPANLFDGVGSGAAYVFRRPAGGWAAATEEVKLTQSDGVDDDELGYGVGVDDALAVIGARRRHTGGCDQAGAAYVYHGLSDCQPNNSPDICDILSGRSPDADGDGWPDECESPEGRAGAVDSLAVTRADGLNITLSWGSSCLPTDHDYGIYEGVLGDFTSHTALFCTTGGATEKTFAPGAGGRYYLLVPRNSDVEGSYGLDSEGRERPPGQSFCRPRVLGVCL